MVNPANLDAAKELAKKYRHVKVEDVYDHREKFTNKNLTESRCRWRPFLYLEEFTGFGSIDSCSLCKTAYIIDGNCSGCVHWFYSEEDFAERVNDYDGSVNVTLDNCTPCGEHDSPSHLTFNAILLAKTPEELVVACQNRAEYLEFLIQEKERIL